MPNPYYDPATQQYHDAAGGTYSGSQYANYTPNRPPAPPTAPQPTAPPAATPQPMDQTTIGAPMTMEQPQPTQQATGPLGATPRPYYGQQQGPHPQYGATPMSRGLGPSSNQFSNAQMAASQNPQQNTYQAALMQRQAGQMAQQQQRQYALPQSNGPMGSYQQTSAGASYGQASPQPSQSFWWNTAKPQMGSQMGQHQPQQAPPEAQQSPASQSTVQPQARISRPGGQQSYR